MIVLRAYWKSRLQLACVVIWNVTLFTINDVMQLVQTMVHSNLCFERTSYVINGKEPSDE